MSDKEGATAPDTGIIFYQTEDGKSRIQVRMQDGTVWLNQRLLAELYQVAPHTISEHISTIYPIFRINIPPRNTFRTPVPSTLKSI